MIYRYVSCRYLTPMRTLMIYVTFPAGNQRTVHYQQSVQHRNVRSLTLASQVLPWIQWVT